MVLLPLLSSIICVFICTIVINVNNVLLSLSPAVNCESSLQSTCWTL